MSTKPHQKSACDELVVDRESASPPTTRRTPTALETASGASQPRSALILEIAFS
jgi:hypothetical protein